MRNAFTLIELLVVLTIITLVMGVVIPKGAKMLRSYERYLERAETKKRIEQKRDEAFLQARDITMQIGTISYLFTKKGVVIESSDDNR